jgi:pimeloyl-ACP methyl ester carboxylesterase
MSFSSANLGARFSRRLSFSTISASVALASLLAASPAAAHPQGDDWDDVFADGAPSDRNVYLDAVEIRPGVTADIHLRVLSNPGPGCDRRVIVAVPGAAASAASLVSTGEAILASSDGDDGGDRACRFISVDLPGHGESPPPVGALFGDLTIEDYAASVLGILDRLQDNGIHTKVLMGHSMGGGVVEVAQQSLVNSGSSLRAAYDLKHVVLLAPGAWPGNASCALCVNTQFAAEIGPYVVFDPTMGVYFGLVPGSLYLQLGFLKPDGAIASNAPSPAEIVASGVDSIESVTAIQEFLNPDPAARPKLDPGIFGHEFGTKLDVITFQQDTLVLPAEGEANYQYVTGESPDHRFATVDGVNAVHDTPLYKGAWMVAALEGLVSLR